MMVKVDGPVARVTVSRADVDVDGGVSISPSDRSRERRRGDTVGGGLVWRVSV